MSQTLQVIFSIALILLASKFLGLLMRRIGLPQVLGSILAGVLLGPAIWSHFIPTNVFFPLQGDIIKHFSEIGVLLVLFSAGLETNLEDLKKMGFVSILIALGGVVIPLALGTLVGLIFIYPTTNDILTAVFLGVIMCATSVGITIETLKELGHLKSKVGTIIISSAIIDDVIGIIVLTIFMSLTGKSADDSLVLQLINPTNNALISILWMLLFFIIAIIGGIFISKLFKHIAEKHPDTHRLPIYSIVVCFLYAVISESIFGVADITGAYIAGVVLSTNHRCAEYVDKKVAVNSYTFFGPIFFAHIGMEISFSGMNLDILLLGITFVVVAILGKIIGCGITAKLCKFSTKDSIKIGVGMIARGEVALVVAQKGISAGLMNTNHLTIVVMLVLVSSVLAPIILKLLYKEKRDFELNAILVNENIEK